MLGQESIEKAAGLDERVLLAKTSAIEAEKLISEFKPFLRSRVARYSSRYDEHLQEDIFSVAMLAFHEAIQSFDSEKGHFFPLADRIVCVRIIDQIRKINRHEGKTVSIDEIDDDEEHSSAQSKTISIISIQNYNESRRREQLVEEIEQFKAEIATWGITMEALVKASPKHKGLREEYKKATALAVKSPDILQTIRLKQYFPIKAVAEISGLPQKKVERGRIFLLSSILIKVGDYELLSDYVTEGG